MKRKRLSRYAMTAEKIARWIAEGRGLGEWETYKPWLTTHDVPSRGVRIRAWCERIERTIHCLSRLEEKFKNWSEATETGDIREQYPHSLDASIAVAGKSHPKDPVTGCLVVMTTDFVLVSERAGKPYYSARCLKYQHELENPRVIEKLTFERQLWSVRPNADWGIITDKAFGRGLVRNLRWLLNARRADYLGALTTRADDVRHFLQPLIAKRDSALVDLTDGADRHFALQAGSALALVKWFIAHHTWTVDLHQKISTHHPLHLQPDEFVQRPLPLVTLESLRAQL